MKNKILVILGPTAAGKSDLAVKLAKWIEIEHAGGYEGAEVISADSRQVYRGLDIGTGKITKEEMRGIPHHLLDIADPGERFTVAKWKEMAEKAVADIHSRSKLPIVCGGTGYYISALVDGMEFPEIESDAEEQKRLEILPAAELFMELETLDPRRADSMRANGESSNKRRLARAILIAKSLGKVPVRRDPFQGRASDILELGISFPDQELKERIRARLKKRLCAGMIEEAQQLHGAGLPFERMDELGLEYRYLAQYLQGKITKEQLTEMLSAKIWQFARRQKTWVRRDKRIAWFSPMEFDKISHSVLDFLRK